MTQGFNCVNEQVPNHADFSTLKIWDRSIHWFKVMTEKLFQTQMNFLVITFKPVDRLIPNFECGKICMFLGLFAKSVSPWSQ